MTTGFVYSFDGEHYQGDGQPTREAAIAEATADMIDRPSKFLPGNTYKIWVGQAVSHDPELWAPNFEDIIETMQDRAYDELGEFADGYLDGCVADRSPEARERRNSEMRIAICGVLEAHGVNYAHHGYTVSDDQEHDVEIPEAA